MSSITTDGSKDQPTELAVSQARSSASDRDYAATAKPRCSGKMSRIRMRFGSFSSIGIPPSKVDFGKGKRMIVKGGWLDTKYNITIPDINLQRKASVNSA